VLDVQRIDERFDEGYMVAWLTLFFAYFPSCLITAPSFGIFLVKFGIGTIRDGFDNMALASWMHDACMLDACKSRRN
jgi:hypothetical protein